MSEDRPELDKKKDDGKNGSVSNHIPCWLCARLWADTLLSPLAFSSNVTSKRHGISQGEEWRWEQIVGLKLKFRRRGIIMAARVLKIR